MKFEQSESSGYHKNHEPNGKKCLQHKTFHSVYSFYFRLASFQLTFSDLRATWVQTAHTDACTSSCKILNVT
jgi:hypothetical protein